MSVVPQAATPDAAEHVGPSTQSRPARTTPVLITALGATILWPRRSRRGRSARALLREGRQAIVRAARHRGVVRSDRRHGRTDRARQLGLDAASRRMARATRSPGHEHRHASGIRRVFLSQVRGHRPGGCDVRSRAGPDGLRLHQRADDSVRDRMGGHCRRESRGRAGAPAPCRPDNSAGAGAGGDGRCRCCFGGRRRSSWCARAFAVDPSPLNVSAGVCGSSIVLPL